MTVGERGLDVARSDSAIEISRQASPAGSELVIDLRGDEVVIDAGASERIGLALLESTPLGRSTPHDVRVPVIRPIVVRHDPIVAGLIRRVLDVVVAGTALVLLAPLAALVAALIALDSPGPVLFRQLRAGRGGEPFEFIKFRTMYVDARERFPDFYDYRFSVDELATMYFKLADDPRLTRFGRWLRRTSLDEIPNLVCVLRGDMTLVGPRPELVEMLRNYEPHQLAKFSVKPGLTGLAQVSGRNILRFAETIQADLEYIERRSLRFDLQILARTVSVVFKQVGAL